MFHRRMILKGFGLASLLGIATKTTTPTESILLGGPLHLRVFDNPGELTANPWIRTSPMRKGDSFRMYSDSVYVGQYLERCIFGQSTRGYIWCDTDRYDASIHKPETVVIVRC